MATPLELALAEMPHWERVSPHMLAPTANFGDWAIKHEATIRAALTPSPVAVDAKVGERLNKVRDALRGAKSELVCLGRELNGLNKTHSHLVKTLPDDETIPMIDEALAILSAVKDKA